MDLGSSELEKYLDVCWDCYQLCLAALDKESVCTNLTATTRFHHLKFDKNDNPKLDALVHNLANHLTHYALNCKKRGGATSEAESNQLYREARGLLRRAATGGEAGELLLYFLLETVLRAPQIVAKMSLKTSTKMEIHGSDGIHIGWDKEDDCLILYLGESKLYKNASDAIDDVANSLNKFYAESALDHEIFLVSSHFKLIEPSIRDEVLKILDKAQSGDFKVVHACLIGFNWREYTKLQTHERKKFISEFSERYDAKAQQLLNLLETKASLFNNKASLQFEFFFLPFASVQDFRDKLLEAV